MRQTLLTQFGAPGCVFGCSISQSIHLLKITTDFVILSLFTGYVVFIITSFLAGVESGDQCLLNSEFCPAFLGVLLSIRSSFLL